ncbi:MAG: DUF4982 domain-containing protein [Clostridia bacterium]|nr:DUF4982 domain-containing protein [Clostridia bacterium]
MIKTCISKGWKFADFPDKPGDYREVDLPHDYAVEKPRDPQGDPLNAYFPVAPAQYVKYVTLPPQRHYILDVDGAYSGAEITFNEELLCLHPHGYTPILVDLTDHVIPGVTNKLKITTNPLPHSTRWYHGCGIYRDVFLWEGGEVRIEPWDLFVYTEGVKEESADVGVKLWLSADLDTKAELRFRVLLDGKECARDSLTVRARRGERTEHAHTLSVSSPALWEPDAPRLYTLVTEVVCDGRVTDTTCVSFGIRTVTVDAVHGLLLNGTPLKLRGGCIHHDHGVLGAAAFPAAEERKIRLLKAAGFNAVRIAHNPPSLALLEVCDRLGMLVMDEAFDVFSKRKLAVTADYHIFFREWWQRDISYMVRRDRNHPSVISYSIGNEIYEVDGTSEGDAWSRRLSAEIRRHDATRLVTAAIQKISIPNFRAEEIDPEDYVAYMQKKRGRGEARQINRLTEAFEAPLDVIGFNYYHEHFKTFHEMYPDKVIWGSENWTKNIYDDWQDVCDNAYVIGDFTWTAYDNLGEVGHGAGFWESEKERYAKGLAFYPWRTCYQGDLDLCGLRRPQSYYREAVWFGGESPRMFVTHPRHYGEAYYGTGWHWADVHESWTFEDRYVGSPIRVDTYIEAERVEWLLNGRKVGKAVPHRAIATLDTVYEKGELVAVAYRDGREFARYALHTLGAPTALSVTPERASLLADRRDLCYFQIAVVDRDGCVDVHNESEISVEVTGGELMGVFSANPISDDDFRAPRCHAFKGRALAIVRAAEPGTVVLTASSPDLAGARAEVTAH